jgi:hypothetical protein
MKVKVQAKLKVSETQFGKTVPKFLRNEIDFLESECYSMDHRRLIEAMKIVHNYYCKPEKWFHEVETKYEAMP